MARICPNCAHTMNPEDFDGTVVDVCSNCQGSWFDADELRALLKKDSAVVSVLEKETARKIEQLHRGSSHLLCPDHQVLLDIYHYMYNSPIELHTCPHCGGFWIAAGSLTGITAMREHVHDPLTPAEEAAILVAQATADEQRAVIRSEDYVHFFGVLRTQTPGWFGLL